MVAVSLLNVVTSAALNTVAATVSVGYNPNAVAIAPLMAHAPTSPITARETCQ